MSSPSRPLRTLREARNHPDGLATKELKEHKDDFLVLSCGKKLHFLRGRCVRLVRNQRSPAFFTGNGENGGEFPHAKVAKVAKASRILG